jgi:hypothetical protein
VWLKVLHKNIFVKKLIGGKNRTLFRCLPLGGENLGIAVLGKMWIPAEKSLPL